MFWRLLAKTGLPKEWRLKLMAFWMCRVRGYDALWFGKIGTPRRKVIFTWRESC